MRLTATLIVTVLSASATFAAPTPKLNLTFTLYHADSYTGPTPTSGWSAIAQFDPILDGSLHSFILKRPNGAVASQKDIGGSSSTGFIVPTFSALTTALTGDWSLDLTTNVGTSHYTLHPDLTGLVESNYPTATMITPSAHQTLGLRPTFAWTRTGSFTYGAADADTYTIGISTSLNNSSPTNWTPSTNLPVGNATFLLEMFDLTVRPYPFTATLTTGPDQGPITTSLSYEYDNYTSYTVVLPEPASRLLLIPALGFLDRRRNRR